MLQPGISNTVASSLTASVIFLVEDDSSIRSLLQDFLELNGLIVESFSSAENFLRSFRPRRNACVVIDVQLLGMDGLQLLEEIKKLGHYLPAVFITGSSNVPMAVEAMKSGAVDFIQKPFKPEDLLARLKHMLQHSCWACESFDTCSGARKLFGNLTVRQRQIMGMILTGHPNKNIAADLGISQRTVEKHRAEIMNRTGSTSLPALTRLSSLATGVGFCGSPLPGYSQQESKERADPRCQRHSESTPKHHADGRPQDTGAAGLGSDHAE